MNDVYFMNKETGELVPGLEVIRNFYKIHNALDSWTDFWIETDTPVKDSFLDFPDFAKCVKV